MYKKINQLSMGERCRIALVKLIVNQANLLVLDKITNYMDILSKECLENVLLHFKGTIIFVSHDIYFIRKLATRLINFNDRGIQLYNCGYDEMIEQIKQKNEASQIGNSYTKLKEELAALELRNAFINGKLCEGSLQKEEKEQLQEEFYRTFDQIKSLRKQLQHS